MKYFLIYTLLLIKISSTVNSMERARFDGFPLLPEEIFTKITIEAAQNEDNKDKDKKIKEKNQIKACFAHTVCKRYANVCTLWHQLITRNMNTYAKFIHMLPIHFAACTDNIRAFVELKMNKKAQIYEKDIDDYSIKSYATGRIKFILQYINFKLPSVEYNAVIQKIIMQLSKKDQKKLNNCIAVLILENKINQMLGRLDHHFDFLLFNSLVLMNGNINAKAEIDGYTFLDLCCRWERYPNYVQYLLSFSEVQQYIIKKNNAQKALETCITFSNLHALQAIYNVENFNINDAHPAFGCFLVSNMEDYAEATHTPLFTFLKTTNLDWETQEQKTGNTPLIQAMQKNNRALLPWLLQEKKVNVNAQNWNGDTALHIAVKRGDYHQKAIPLLLDSNANVSLPNKEGQTPIDVATSDHIKKLLLSRM